MVIHNLRGMYQQRMPTIESIPINEVLRQMEKLMQGDSVMREVPLTLDLTTGLPQVLADRVQLKQCLLNLITNAVHAMEETPASTRDLILRSRPSADGGVRVSVQDRGHGLKDATLEQLARPRYTTREQGMGLGLAITRTLIEAQGGRLWARSNGDGIGATFGLELPPVPD